MASRADELIDELLDRALRGESVDVEAAIAARPDLDEAERGEVRALAATLGDGMSRPGSTTERNEAGSFGAYILTRELGRGGQGVVWLARDTRLNRKVALKVLDRPDLVFDATRSPSGPAARLRREAEVASKLEHPSICTVYETGVERGRPFIAMRFVDGETLARKIVALKERADARTASATATRRDRMARVAIIEAVARALHFAHEAGVVHRDIKPANVMITPAGEPVVLDFGLARDDASDAPTLTASGEVFGSPAYMAPEQIEPRRGAVDRRTDVWALGVVLYELLTLRRPFEAPTREGLYRAILSDPLRDPREVEPGIERDLAVVVATALERDRGRRYQSALDLAEDLRRVRAREPILARPAGAGLRVRRWTQRNPALATALATIFLGLAAVLVESLRAVARERAHARELEARSLLNAASVAADRDPSLALRFVAAAAERGTLPALAANETLLTALSGMREIARVQGLEAPCYIAAAARDRAWIALAKGRAVEVWSWRTRERVASLEHSAGVGSLEFSADGRWLAVGGWGRAAVWRTSDWRRRGEVEVPRASYVRVSPTATRLLACGGGALGVCELGEDGLSNLDLGVAGELTDQVFGAMWSADGRRILVELERGAAIVEPGASGRVEIDGARPAGLVTSYAFAETAAAIGCEGGAILVDAVEGRVLARLAVGGGAPAVATAFGPGARTVLVGDVDGTVRMYDVATADLVFQSRALGAPVASAEFDASGTRILIRASIGGAVGVLDAANGDLIARLFSVPAANSACWDGGEVVTADESGAVRRWSVESRAERDTLDGLGHPGWTVAFDASGARVAARDRDSIRVYEVSTRRSLGTLPVVARWFEFDPNGDRLVTTSNAKDENEGVVLWDTSRFERIRTILRHEEDVSSASYSPDGRRLVVACCDDRAHVVDVESGAILRELEGHTGDLRSAVYSDDGRYVVTSSEHLDEDLGIDDRTVRVWDGESGAELAILRFAPLGERPVIARFAPGARRVSVATWSGGVALWDWRAGELRWLRGHVGDLNDASFSRDGRSVLSGARDRTLRLWSAESGELVALYSGHGSNVYAHAISPDGRTIASQSTDGMLRFWPLDPLAEARDVLARLGPPTSYELERIAEALSR